MTAIRVVVMESSGEEREVIMEIDASQSEAKQLAAAKYQAGWFGATVVRVESQ